MMNIPTTIANNMNVADFMAKVGTSWDYGLFLACSFNRLDLVNLMITNGADNWNWGMVGACQGGHLDFVNLMISKGAKNWNLGLLGASGGYHPDMPNVIECAKLMISKGANYYRCLRNSKNLFLYRLFCKRYAVHDVERLHKLIREQDPLYTLVIHYHAGSGPHNELPMDLLRYCKSFLS